MPRQSTAPFPLDTRTYRFPKAIAATLAVTALAGPAQSDTVGPKLVSRGQTNELKTNSPAISLAAIGQAGSARPAAATVSLASATTINSLAEIVNDMKLPGEGFPHGFPDSDGNGEPDWDWMKGPVIQAGNTPPPKFTAAIAWGTLYIDSGGNPSLNSRVQLRKIRMYILSKSTRRWNLAQWSPGTSGENFLEDLAGNVNVPADERLLSDGSIAVKLADGYCYHFWTSTGMSKINPRDIGGVFTTVQARVVVDNPERPDDTASARYLLNMGGDYWRYVGAPYAGLDVNNVGIAIGRFKFVGSTWKAFNMSTLTEAQLRSNPPPLE